MASSDNLVKSFRYLYSDELLMFIQKVTIIKRTIARHCPLQKKKKHSREKLSCTQQKYIWICVLRFSREHMILRTSLPKTSSPHHATKGMPNTHGRSRLNFPWMLPLTLKNTIWSEGREDVHSLHGGSVFFQDDFIWKFIPPLKVIIQ